MSAICQSVTTHLFSEQTEKSDFLYEIAANRKTCYIKTILRCLWKIQLAKLKKMPTELNVVYEKWNNQKTWQCLARSHLCDSIVRHCTNGELVECTQILQNFTGNLKFTQIQFAMDVNEGIWNMSNYFKICHYKSILVLRINRITA